MFFFQLTVLILGLHLTAAQTPTPFPSGSPDPWQWMPGTSPGPWMNPSDTSAWMAQPRKLGHFSDKVPSLECGMLDGAGSRKINTNATNIGDLCMNMEFSVDATSISDVNSLQLKFYLGSLINKGWELIAEDPLPPNFDENNTMTVDNSMTIPLSTVNWVDQPCGIRLFGVEVYDTTTFTMKEPDTYIPVVLPCKGDFWVDAGLMDGSGSPMIMPGQQLNSIFTHIKVHNTGGQDVNAASSMFARQVLVMVAPYWVPDFWHPDSQIVAVDYFTESFTNELDRSDFLMTASINFTEGRVCGDARLAVGVIPYTNGMFHPWETNVYVECHTTAPTSEDHQKNATLVSAFGSDVLVHYQRDPYQEGELFYYKISDNTWSPVNYYMVQQQMTEFRLSKLALQSMRHYGLDRDMAVNKIKTMLVNTENTDSLTVEEDILANMRAMTIDMADSPIDYILYQLEQISWSSFPEQSFSFRTFNETFFSGLAFGLSEGEYLTDSESIKKQIQSAIFEGNRNFMQLQRDREQGNSYPSTGVVYNIAYVLGLTWRTSSPFHFLADSFFDMLVVTSRYYSSYSGPICPLRLFGDSLSKVTAFAYDEAFMDSPAYDAELPILIKAIGTSAVYGFSTVPSGYYCGLDFGYEFSPNAANYHWRIDGNYVYVGMKSDSGQWHYTKKMMFHCNPCYKK